MRSRLFTPLAVIGVFLADRLSKLWVMEHFSYGEVRPLLPFFRLTYLENTGAAFSIGQGRNTALIVLSAAILVVLLAVERRMGPGRPGLRAGLGLVIGGALGNLYDRISYGSVIDFLDFFWGARHWPAFNLADAAICVGAAGLLYFQRRSAGVPEP